MGMSALVLDMEAQKMAEAVERANQWAVAATPMIRALIALEAVEHPICDIPDRDDREFCFRPLNKAAQEFRDAVTAYRDTALADLMPPMPARGDEAAWDARDEFADELDRQCITVDAAIKLVEREA